MRLQTKQAQQVMQNEAWGQLMQTSEIWYIHLCTKRHYTSSVTIYKWVMMSWRFGIAGFLEHSIHQIWTTKILTISMENRKRKWIEQKSKWTNEWVVLCSRLQWKEKRKRKRHIFPEFVILELMMEQEQQCFPTETWTRFQPRAPWRWEPASLWQDIWSLSMATRGSVSPP